MSERLSADTRLKIETFLEEYADSTEAICPDCIAEYRADLTTCPQCGCEMAQGKAGLRLLGERLADDRVALAENAAEAYVESGPKEVWDGPTDEGTCPRCGRDVDPDTDACEECLDDLVEEMNKEEEEVQECADEVFYVKQMSHFLATSQDEQAEYCPTCLLAAEDECQRCGGELVTLAEALDIVRLARLEITEKWWTPLLSSDNQDWFDVVLQMVADAEVDSRTAADFTDNFAYFSPMLADMQRCRRTIYLRLRDFPSFVKMFSEREVEKEWAQQWSELSKHVLNIVADAGFEEQ